jgi:ribulose-phosphate 3-epimerase
VITTIVPTITTADPTDFAATIEKYSHFSKSLHVDVADGTISANKTVLETNMTFPAGLKISMHIMTANPSAHIEQILTLKPELAIFQAEVAEDLTPILEKLRENNIRAGLALVKTSYPGLIKPLIELCDHVLIFSGDLGVQGGVADLLQLEKVNIIKSINPNAEIGWDGGANIMNARTIAQAGVAIINVGSAIATAEDPAASWNAMTNDLDKQGVLI